MSDEILRKQAAITPPRTTTTFVVATSTTPASIDVSAYVGRYVTLVAQGADAFILFASTQAAAELVDNTATSGATVAQMIPQNGSADFLLGADDKFVGVETSTGTGKLRLHVSSGRTGPE
jgi:hypothetical protein